MKIGYFISEVGIPLIFGVNRIHGGLAKLQC